MAERLDRERVVRAALALLDEVGLDGLTLRRLAQDLGVKAPALYWHFASKADLLHEMAATML
ncbi:MAG: TetR family transcriptional regulator, partial [Oerskovia sp.]|nr:TetR family transcriptional regulator [Oerskovia sp.]